MSGLFGELPEQRGGSAAASEARPRLRTAERRQVALRMCCLDDLLEPEHQARGVWQFVGRLDLSGLRATIRSVEGGAGHPAADPQILVALWLYATLRGVGSARELARLCADHVAYQWLCGGVGMNHHTLADFRTRHMAWLDATGMLDHPWQENRPIHHAAIRLVCPCSRADTKAGSVSAAMAALSVASCAVVSGIRFSLCNTQ